MNNNLIWVFREPRSGSSWVSNALMKKLNKHLYHYDTHVDRNTEFDPLSFNDNNMLYSTHLFHLLPQLKVIDPYIIRTTRRNKTEQCLSMLYWNYFPDSIKHYFVDESKNTSMDNFNKSLVNPVTVTKDSIIDLMLKMKQRDKLWADNFKDFKSDVIVYEDLMDQAHISKLDITLSFNTETQYSHKMPEYKTKAFKNYQQAVDWCEEIAQKLKFIQY